MVLPSVGSREADYKVGLLSYEKLIVINNWNSIKQKLVTTTATMVEVIRTDNREISNTKIIIIIMKLENRGNWVYGVE